MLAVVPDVRICTNWWWISCPGCMLMIVILWPCMSRIATSAAVGPLVHQHPGSAKSKICVLTRTPLHSGGGGNVVGRGWYACCHDSLLNARARADS